MEPLTLKLRQPVESPEIESWDDDDFDNVDDIHIRTASTATSVISHSQTGHRDSISSRLSIRSESNQGDENWDVLVDETASVKDAIAIAKSKGIPIPADIPRSALEGGTIRRLKGKEIKKAIADDWSEDLDLHSFNAPLKLAKTEDKDFPETLRQISAAFHKSPVTTQDMKEKLNQTIRSPKSRPAAPISLDQFRDNDDDDSFGDVPTIRVAKHRSPQKPTLFQPPRPKVNPDLEDLEENLELPSNGQLKLSTRKPLPRTPQQNDDFDMEWAEGSLGIRDAGTRRAGRSNRSSSVSALSPSVSSAFTAESEDEGLDGLVLPAGPLKFEEVLKKRQENQSPDHSNYSGERNAARRAAARDDFFAGIEIGDGDPFDSAKLTLHRNIKHKTQRPTSPSKRATTTLNFTSTKTQSTISRLPRFQPSHERHDRVRSNLEPVSESGAAVSRFRRPESRLSGYAAQSAVSGIPAPSTPSTPSTPSRRGLRTAESRSDMRYEAPTTTNAQLLKAKRSMPVMRGLTSPTKPSAYPRPPSRQDGSGFVSRLNIPSRPKTPTERVESRLGESRKPPIPFLPAGGSAIQSQHISIKATTSRHNRRQDSDGSNDGLSLAQRALSRLAGRPETPGRGRASLTPAELAAAAKKTITKPTRRRNFGDGTELEIFDDLPTSATQESRFVKQPIGRGAPRSLRNKLGQTIYAPSTTSLASVHARPGAETPMPVTPITPIKQEFISNANIPRFARDTAASRNAREQRQVSTTFHNMRGEPLQPITTNGKAQVLNRPGPSPSLRKHRSGKLQQKPHLIKPMGNDVSRPKTEKGMSYNPTLYRWEGNENALGAFEVPDFTPRDSSPPGHGSPGSKPPALITNVGHAGGVQVVGGMVFDPRRMCWLKMAEGADKTGNLRGGSVQLEEEEDVFAGLEDLKEEDERSSRFGGGAGSVYSSRLESGVLPSNKARNVSGESADAAVAEIAEGHSGDEWGVSEEFDVGPEFVRRQRSEEEKWKRKVEKWLRASTATESREGVWLGQGDQRAGGWRWAVRDLVVGGVS